MELLHPLIDASGSVKAKMITPEILAVGLYGNVNFDMSRFMRTIKVVTVLSDIKSKIILV